MDLRLLGATLLALGAGAAQQVPTAPAEQVASAEEPAPEAPVASASQPSAEGRRATAAATWRGFPAFLWRQDYFGEEAPAELFEGLGGTNIERDRDEPWVFEQGLDLYVGHAPGRDELYLDKEHGPYAKQWRAWVEDRDPARLVREPCLTDPDTREKLAEALARTLSARTGCHGIGVSLGDEVSLTPFGDPFDVCFSETCSSEWAQRSGRAFQGAVDTEVLTDAVRLAVGEGRTEAIGPWLAKRAFHRDVLIEVLAELAAKVREQAPGTGVGLLGITGSTAFGGLPIDRLVPLLDFIECYSVGDSRELFATLHRDDQRTLTTIFPDPGNPDGAAWQVWEHWLRGGDGVVVWSDRTLIRDKDFAGRLRAALADVRRLRAELPDFHPRPAGVAVVNDPRAVAAAWLRDALLDGPTWPNRFAGYQETHGTRERALNTWLRLLEDSGLLPGSIPIDSIAAEIAERFPVLVLVHQLVLDPADLRRLTAYVRAGGRLVVEGELGWVDASGKRLDGAPLRTLRDQDPDAIVGAPAGLERYLAARRDSTGLAQELRATVRGWLAPREQRRALAPWKPKGDAAALPWLTASQRMADGSTICIALPNWTTPRDRGRRLEDVRLEVDIPANRTLTWLHPSTDEAEPTVVLPAGDAAVFRLSAPALKAPRER